MNAIVAYTKYERYGGDPFIQVETFHNGPDLLNCLINDLDLCDSDSEYIPDDNYEEDLKDAIRYMEEHFLGDGSYWVTAITIVVDDQILFRG